MINILMLLVAFVIIFYVVKRCSKGTSERVCALRALFVVLVLFAILYSQKESFLFQVSPSKRVRCCPKGFYGMPIEFHYQGDSSRFTDCNDCQNKNTIPKQTSSYTLLDDTYNEKAEMLEENYRDLNFAHLGQTWVGDRVKPNDAMYYASQGHLGGNMNDVLKEEYCGGGCGGAVMEGFCGSCQ